MNIDERLEALTTRHEALTARHEALTMNIELLSHDREKDNRRIEQLLILAEKAGENIRGLVRVAELHERRLSHLEGSEQM